MSSVNEIAGEMARILKVATATDALTGQPPAVSGLKQYQIVPGDIIWNKSKDWKVPFNAIQQANPNIDLGRVRPGDIIYLPPEAQAPTYVPEPPKPTRVFIENPQYTSAVLSKVMQLASSTGIPAGLFVKLIVQESHAQAPNAQPGDVDYLSKSHAGAMGLGQLMPANVPEGKNPMDPVTSVELMIGHLVTNKRSSFAEAQILLTQRRYLGKENYTQDELIEMALYVYNAGMPTVSRAIKLAKRTGNDFRAWLPAETRNYAPSIMKMSIPDLKVGTVYVQ